ncbi:MULTISPECIES: ABC transporter permease [Streptococcus]|uniref:ABC transporter permease n=1 Tax=Streptococcus TaxID=1301 RepID=UPI0005E16E80|nr:MULTISPECIES: ABC transporter permease [Streptococcus]MBF9649396.1 ABC transporter permease [Streptococcus pseudopneumoniae]MBW8105658.1 ABC transporter permease [Streptococcus pseudopneumoniae]MBW8143881.1 ABC transporter permease [Streptococcus pseudopneumoniae]NIB83691.1 ABC transporter permease [Streptococcus pseudopneumoniae]NIB95761.1 ABC transporter permease [Streptococcus pseudopneumoniae]
MFRLTNKLAVSNLIKNRKLYYPFALAVLLAVTVTYLFYSLTFNPKIAEIRGGTTIQATLGFGMFVVTLASAIIVLYANSFVMKNRSKELGIYGMLGLEKRHLISMTFKELVVFGILTVGAGIGIGALFDKLIFAFLLKLMKLKVELVATFQMNVVIAVLVVFGLIFLGLMFLNALRIARMNALQLSREKASGEKRGRFLPLQTILGSISLGIGYYLALTVTDPLTALTTFFLAVLLVIFGTYLLFNAGITVFLQILKKNKKYYYQPNNLISVSNLIFRMKKNAVGLATIAILSTMVLVTMSAATSIFNASESFKKVMNPHDFGITGKNVEKEDLDKLLSQFASDKGYSVKEKEVLRYSNFGIANQEGTKLTIFEKGQNRVQPKTVFMVFDQKDYENMTGQKLSLSGNEVGLFAKNDGLKGQKALTLNDHQFSVKEEFNKDFIVNHVPNQFNILTTDYNYLVVPDLQAFLDQFPDSAIYNQFYGGMNVINVSEEEQLKVAEEYEKYLNQFNAQLDTEGSYVYGSNLADASSQMSALFGGVFFIGIFLSIIFMVGTVLVIYYKQISEGYEDRERFIILQKVGLDQKQIKQTINKQVLTVFFLPLLFAFIHLAFAYHMLSLILKVIGVIDTNMMLIVTLSICAIFLIAYVLIFMITSRSYRKIVQM